MIKYGLDWIDKTWTGLTKKNGLMKDTLTLSRTLGHVSDLAPLQPSQILSCPVQPKTSVFHLKENTSQRGQSDTYGENQETKILI